MRKINIIRDFYLKGKWKYYELAETLKEVKENLKNPKVRKLAPFAFSIPAAIVIQGIMPSLAKGEESLESLKAKVEEEITKDESGWQFNQVLEEYLKDYSPENQALAYKYTLEMFTLLKEARKIADKYDKKLDEKKSVRENAEFLYNKIKSELKGEDEGDIWEAALRTAYAYVLGFYYELNGGKDPDEKIINELFKWNDEKVGEIGAKNAEITKKNLEEIAGIKTLGKLNTLLTNYEKLQGFLSNLERRKIIEENKKLLDEFKSSSSWGLLLHELLFENTHNALIKSLKKELSKRFKLADADLNRVIEKLKEKHEEICFYLGLNPEVCRIELDNEKIAELISELMIRR